MQEKEERMEARQRWKENIELARENTILLEGISLRLKCAKQIVFMFEDMGDEFLSLCEEKERISMQLLSNYPPSSSVDSSSPPLRDSFSKISHQSGEFKHKKDTHTLDDIQTLNDKDIASRIRFRKAILQPHDNIFFHTSVLQMYRHAFSSLSDPASQRYSTHKKNETSGRPRPLSSSKRGDQQTPHISADSQRSSFFHPSAVSSYLSLHYPLQDSSPSSSPGSSSSSSSPSLLPSFSSFMRLSLIDTAAESLEERERMAGLLSLAAQQLWREEMVNKRRDQDICLSNILLHSVKRLSKEFHNTQVHRNEKP